MYFSFDEQSSHELIVSLKDIRDRAPDLKYFNLEMMIPSRWFFDRQYAIYPDIETALTIFEQFVDVYAPEDLIVGEWFYAYHQVKELRRRFDNYNPFVVNLENTWQIARSHLGGGFLRVAPPHGTLIERHNKVLDFIESFVLGRPQVSAVETVEAVESLVQEAIKDARLIDDDLETALSSLDRLRVQAAIVGPV